MRMVILDEETLEPITVVNLPGMTDMCLEERRHWRVALPMQAPAQPVGPRKDGPERDLAPSRKFSDEIRYIDLEFERSERFTLTRGIQSHWLCLTRAADLAMLLTPDWLPGQRPAIERLQEENVRLSELMMTALTSDLR